MCCAVRRIGTLLAAEPRQRGARHPLPADPPRDDPQRGAPVRPRLSHFTTSHSVRATSLHFHFHFHFTSPPLFVRVVSCAVLLSCAVRWLCRLPEDWHLHSNERAVKSTLKRIAEIQNQLDSYNLCAQVCVRAAGPTATRLRVVRAPVRSDPELKLFCCVRRSFRCSRLQTTHSCAKCSRCRPFSCSTRIAPSRSRCTITSFTHAKRCVRNDLRAF